MLRSILLFIFCAFTISTQAQNKDFCDAVNVILRDGKNQFRNVRNPVADKMQGNTMFKSQINVPGTIASRFIVSGSMFYEGALKQAKTPEELADAYTSYRNILNDCLASKGYVMREVQNHNKGLEKYHKTLFMPDFKAGDSAPSGHIAMEMDYNKLSGMCTLTLYIYEH